MRVRTRRFAELRLHAKLRDSELGEERVGQGAVERHGRVLPPAAPVGRDLRRATRREAAGNELAVDRAALPPLLELDGPEAVTDPFVESREDARRLGELKVFVPAPEVRPQV